MAEFRRLLKCVGQAVLAKGLRCLVDCVPLGGLLWDVAEDALQRLREQEKDEAIRAEVQTMANADAKEVRSQAEQVVAEVAGDQPAPVRESLLEYLVLIPETVRRSLMRPQDPTGRTVPPTLTFRGASELVPMLPAGPPRFRPGDHPPGNEEWTLVERLGMGGFGEVWKARHNRFGGTIAAIKFCLDPDAKDRLLRHEGTILNEIMAYGRHPGIVPLVDARLEVEPPWLRYEFIEGGDLAHQFTAKKFPTPAEQVRWACQLLRQLAHTVGHFHRLPTKVVHRDLKPGNILLQRDLDGTWVPRIADFGIGDLIFASDSDLHNRASRSDSGLTTRAQKAYTPLYASAQQQQGLPADPRDDVHALGVLWYQLLIGDLDQGIGPDYQDDLREMGVSDAIIGVLGRCIANKPERRPRDGVELAELLEPLLAAPSRVDQGAVAATSRPAAATHRAGDALARAGLREVVAAPFLSLDGYAGGIYSLAFSADGKWLAGAGYQKPMQPGIAQDWTVGLWAVADGVLQAPLNGGQKVGYPFFAPALAFSADGHLLASSHAHELRLWSLPEGKLLIVMPVTDAQGNTWQIKDLAFSPDGRLLAVASHLSTTSYQQGAMHLWSVPEGKWLLSLPGSAVPDQHIPTVLKGTAEVARVVFSPDGRRLLTVSLENLRLWSLPDGKELAAIRCATGWPAASVTAAAFSPDEQLLAAVAASGWINEAQLWSVPDGKKLAVANNPIASDDAIRHVAFSGDGRLLVTMTGYGAKFWTVPECKPVFRFVFGEEAPADAWGRRQPRVADQLVAVSPDFKLLATATGPTVKLWQNLDEAEWREPPGRPERQS